MNGNLIYTVERKIGDISSSKNGWTMELNLISWNHTSAKYDIRKWDEEHSNMSKGITLTKDECISLVKLLSKELKNEQADTPVF